MEQITLIGNPLYTVTYISYTRIFRHWYAYRVPNVEGRENSLKEFYHTHDTSSDSMREFVLRH